MSVFSDIIDGSHVENLEKGLVYTRKCGWIDLGHARASGANKLWQKIQLGDVSPNEMYKTTYQWILASGIFLYPSSLRNFLTKLNIQLSNEALRNLTIDIQSNSITGINQLPKTQKLAQIITNSGYFLIGYSQDMKKSLRPYGVNIVLRHGVDKIYAIKQHLPVDIKKSVTLSIYLDVSHAFEQLQASWPYSLVTDSGYSVEDLISNMVGFYRATNPGIRYIEQCEPVSKEEAIYVWRTYGSVGSIKNKQLSPYLFPTSKDSTFKPTIGKLPDFLNIVVPSQAKNWYFEVN